MGVVINNITFTNYRQYGTGTMSFNTSDSGMLSVFVAKNGTGKTTLLNAITWCLYGKELHLSDDKTALPIVTSEVVRKANHNDMIPVEVTISITDENSVVEFKRRNTFKVYKTDQKNKIISGHDTLTVTTTKIGSFSNTEVKNNSDAEMIVKRYFDENIFKFYFFDGEKLRDFFTTSASQANSVQQSIFNISQISMLENSCSRLKTMLDERAKKLAKDSPDIAKLNQEYEEQEKLKASAESTRDINEKAVDKLYKECSELDDILRKYEPVKKLQEEKEELLKKLNYIQKETADLRIKRTSFIRKYTVLIVLYPRIKKSLEIIEEKEAKGDLPPTIDKNLIKKLLENPDQHCPICDSSIDETAIEHIQRLLTQFSVSSKTSNYLKEIKGSLEVAIDDIGKFDTIRQELIQTEIDINERRTKTEERLDEIGKILSNFDSDSDKLNISEIEKKRSDNIYKTKIANESIGSAKITIQNCEAELRSIEEQRSVLLKKMDEHNEMRKQISVIKMLYSNFKKIKDSIIKEMKEEIEKITWEYFDRMIWKKNTFGHITISDKYDITVYNKDGIEMTGSLSATEQMALAYAFTLAIHKASGKNCPLVIDSPLGRVSDENREKMAEALKEVSKNKQIIMLFTPDEYSEEVKSIYEGTTVVRELVLTEDENYVEGIE